jgi:hypothetical protein
MGRISPIRKIREIEEFVHYRENAGLWWKPTKGGILSIIGTLIVFPVTIYYFIKRDWVCLSASSPFHFL